MWIVHVDVTDDDRYADYIKGSTEVAAKYGGEFIARGGKFEQKDGTAYARNVLVRYGALQPAARQLRTARGYRGLRSAARHWRRL
jgi:uncharacterized protein (DUF1330 family)